MKAPRTAIAGLVLSASTLVGIALHEQYRGDAYYATPDEKARGISTVGFGATEGVKPSDKTTPERALVRLLSDAGKFEQAVKRCAPVPLYQHEFDSFVSLAYNIGSGAFCGSSIPAKLRVGDYEAACKTITQFVCVQTSHDKRETDPAKPCYNKMRPMRELRGLTIRRQAEYKQCMGAE